MLPTPFVTEPPASPPPLDADSAIATLAALGTEQALVRDPVRLRYLESLGNRLSAASPAVRRVLLARFSQAVSEYRQCLTPVFAQAEVVPDPGSARPFASVFARRRAAASGVSPATTQLADGPTPSPLAMLNRYIHQIARGSSAGAARQLAGDGSGSAEGWTDEPANTRIEMGNASPIGLKSARRFSETWSKLQSEHLVEQALQRAPENAGPFNPHWLIVRSLATLQQLSPDYVHQFIQHADALLRLEQVMAQLPAQASKPKPAKSARARK